MSNFQGDQKTVQDIENSRQRVVVCLSCLPRDHDICLRHRVFEISRVSCIPQ